ncbi:hypothetical protein llap_1221 [Limosa lapponica baueri]|uniref:Uncharacterized protein n=1 Tax=Limosa lapponica baueri TaxID=1758121 RepID=A0A2I0UR18_LIMLA|nr:hypothetical protein llap_1221 [Limosa lapponica baueri]
MQIRGDATSPSSGPLPQEASPPASPPSVAPELVVIETSGLPVSPCPVCQGNKRQEPFDSSPPGTEAKNMHGSIQKVMRNFHVKTGSSNKAGKDSEEVQPQRTWCLVGALLRRDSPAPSPATSLWDDLEPVLFQDSLPIPPPDLADPWVDIDHVPSVSYNTGADKLGQTNGLFIL